MLVSKSTRDVIERVDRELTALKNRNPFVCVCGHPASRHSETEDSPICRASRLDCRCHGLLRVLKVSDTRYFLRKTTGYGADHALMRGKKSAENRGVDVDWVENLACQQCWIPHSEAALFPILIEIDRETGKFHIPGGRSKHWISAPEAIGMNGLLCFRCLQDFIFLEH